LNSVGVSVGSPRLLEITDQSISGVVPGNARLGL